MGKSNEKKSGTLSIRIPISLHEELAQQAAKEGVSVNHYISLLLTYGVTVGKFTDLLLRDSREAIRLFEGL